MFRLQRFGYQPPTYIYRHVRSILHYPPCTMDMWLKRSTQCINKPNDKPCLYLVGKNQNQPLCTLKVNIYLERIQLGQARPAYDRSTFCTLKVNLYL